MANINAYIRKEVEKGNTLMDKKGNFINPEKLENSMRKSYVAGLKDGSVSFEKPFAEYQQEEIEKTFIPVSALELGLTAYFEPSQSECMSVPEEPQETVAQ
jgi:hypothetical protein